jgi:hypothetical protein
MDFCNLSLVSEFFAITLRHSGGGGYSARKKKYVVNTKIVLIISCIKLSVEGDAFRRKLLLS